MPSPSQTLRNLHRIGTGHHLQPGACAGSRLCRVFPGHTEGTLEALFRGLAIDIVMAAQLQLLCRSLLCCSGSRTDDGVLDCLSAALHWFQLWAPMNHLLHTLNVTLNTTPQVVSAHKMRHPRFARLAAKMARAAPPCTADDGDWRGAAGWLDEGDVPESDAALHAAPMPDFTRECPQVLGFRMLPRGLPAA
jgi:hypothetical protein